MPDPTGAALMDDSDEPRLSLTLEAVQDLVQQSNWTLRTLLLACFYHSWTLPWEEFAGLSFVAAALEELGHPTLAELEAWPKPSQSSPSVTRTGAESAAGWQ